MKIYRSIQEFRKGGKTVVTSGTFDGMHLGHRGIIARVKEVATREGGEAVVLTFFPHPRTVLYPDDNDLKLINTIEERIELLAKEGVDHLIVHPFTKEFSRLKAVDFVRSVLVNTLGVTTLITGYNHQFGRNREGSFSQLAELAQLYGFAIEQVAPQYLDGVAISSTKIRKALLDGQIALANRYLGYDFYIGGKVIHGNKIGRELGFPTANIHVEESYKLIPSEGVYAVKVQYNNRVFRGMLNIASHFPDGNGNPKIEVHMLEFDEVIYGESLRVLFKEKLREEQRFDSSDALRVQIEKDKEQAIKVLA